MEESPHWKPNNPTLGQSSLISQLIYDIFGGEILKTRRNKSWHFYNRIDGEIIDFTKSEMDNFFNNKNFEDLPSSPDETHAYFAQEDYLIFLRRFIRAFEYDLHQKNYS
ncbi:MAG: hypothetical protein P1P86_11910 [Bacteroidales bacterium]|nr:hypothetical protein [Bacteroidales bacterium]